MKNPRYKIGQTVYLAEGKWKDIKTGIVLEVTRVNEKNFSYKILKEDLKMTEVRQANVYPNKQKIVKKFSREVSVSGQYVYTSILFSPNPANKNK